MYSSDEDERQVYPMGEMPGLINWDDDIPEYILQSMEDDALPVSQPMEVVQEPPTRASRRGRTTPPPAVAPPAPPPVAAPPAPPPVAAPRVPAVPAVAAPSGRPPIPPPDKVWTRENLKKHKHIMWTREEMVFPAKVITSGVILKIQKMQPVFMPGCSEVTFTYSQGDHKIIEFDEVIRIIKTPEVVPESRRGVPSKLHRYRVPEVQPWWATGDSTDDE